jgi:hypothetical protein
MVPRSLGSYIISVQRVLIIRNNGDKKNDSEPTYSEDKTSIRVQV